MGSMGSVSCRCFEDLQREQKEEHMAARLIALSKDPEIGPIFRRKRLCGESERNKMKINVSIFIVV